MLSDINIITHEEKQLLLHCINNYLEKINFVLKNGKYYNVDDFVIKDFKKDYKKILCLRQKIFSVEIFEFEEEGS